MPVCLATLAALGFDLEAERGIRPDLEDRPQKSPRACVIAADPPRVVHLITRAQGGLHDYEAFLHEAGHALHYAGCDPTLPLAFRRLARDHALSEIYSFLLDSISGEPGWHAEHFGLSDEQARENADAARFSNTILFRRYSAKLGYEMDFWTRFPSRRRHTGRVRGAAHGRNGCPVPGREPSRRHGRRLLLGRLPPCVDPLGPAPRAPPPRGGGGLVAPARDGGAPARPLPRGHTADDASRSPSGSASTRSTPRRSSPSSNRRLSASGCRAGRGEATPWTPTAARWRSSQCSDAVERGRPTGAHHTLASAADARYKTPESGLRF